MVVLNIDWFFRNRVIMVYILINQTLHFKKKKRRFFTSKICKYWVDHITRIICNKPTTRKSFKYYNNIWPYSRWGRLKAIFHWRKISSSFPASHSNAGQFYFCRAPFTQMENELYDARVSLQRGKTNLEGVEADLYSRRGRVVAYKQFNFRVIRNKCRNGFMMSCLLHVLIVDSQYTIPHA